MKKLFLIGAAAGLSALTTTAHAADLPIAPEPVDYLRICDAYGTKFFYLPGTETCLRVGGRLRVEYRFNNYGSGPNNWGRNTADATSFRARSYIYLDAKTNTEFGLLRVFSSTFFNTNTSSTTSTANQEYAFIQFGGFTFGKTQSFWDYWTGYSYGAQVSSYSDTKSNVIAYTGTFGNGVSASVSLEHADSRQSALITSGTNGYASSHKIPDAIANIRIDQGWGSAQLMGALHDVRFANAAAKGKVGWVIGGGVEVKVPVMGQTDSVVLQVAYSDGASAFPLDSWDSQITDAINVNGKTKTTRTFNIAAGWQHNFTKEWQGNIEGSYNAADAATDAYDFAQWGITGNVVWSPVAGLNLGAEMQYRDVDYNAASGLSDKHELYTTLRVQRTF